MRSIREYRWLQYILLTMLLINYQQSESANIARDKTTSSSTTLHTGRGSDNAVDGKFERNNYFRTRYDTNQWWKVDLGKLYYIVQIKVTGYDRYRFEDVSILVTSEPTTSADPDPASSEWSVVVSGISLPADDIKVTYDPISRGDVVPQATQVALYCSSYFGLSITEAEVFGYENSALGKTTSASSVYAGSDDPGHVASWAVDGLFKDRNYYRSDAAEDNWWRVDLAGKLFIIAVKVYHLADQNGKASEASLLLGNSTTNPALTGTQWILVFQQMVALPDNCEVCYFEYDPIAEADPIPLARYVAVYSEYRSGLAFREVLVFAAGEDDFSPNNLQATLGDTDDCATVSWEPPITAALVYYEMRHDKGNWLSVGTSQNTQICDLLPYQTVDIDVRALGSTIPTSATIINLCAESANIARDKTTSSSSAYSGTGSDKAVDGNFGGINYFRTVYNSSNQWWKVDLGKLYYIVQIKVTGYDPALFKDVSILVTSEPTTSADPDPASSEWSVVLSGISLTSASNKVTYDPIIRGDIVPQATQVALYCSNNIYGMTVTEVEVFGYEPCPPVFRDLTAPLRVPEAGGIKLLYTVSWLAPPDISYDSITRYEVRYPTNTSTPIDVGTDTSTVVTADGDVEITFSVRVKNNVNLYSEYRTMTFTTEKIVPIWGVVATADLRADNTSCVTLSWTKPQYPGELLHYQYLCTQSTDRTTIEATKLSTQICRYSAYSQVQCDVIAVNSQGESRALMSLSLRTHCTAPSAPLSIQFGDTSIDTDEGRRRRRYTVSWQPPLEINCDSITSYKTRFPATDSDTVTTTSNSREVYTDGNEEITFWVKAVNNVGTSLAATRTIISQAFRPQETPTSVILEVKNSSCVRLSWQPPEHPNGLITSYEHNCTGSDTWLSIEGAARSALICGLSANQKVQCDIRARNDKGYSDVATKDAVLNCAAPDLPEDISNYMTEQGYNLNGTAEERIKIKLDIPQQDIVVNCESLTILEYKLASDKVYTANGEYIESLTVLTEYTINIRAVNNENLESIVNWTFKTGELRPGDPPSLELNLNTSCVTLNISPPTRPNGVISYYLYNCEYSDVEETKRTGANNQYNVSTADISNGNLPSICNFTSASKIQCSASAVNSAGQSPPGYGEGYTGLKFDGVLKAEIDVPSHGKYVNVLLKEVKLTKGEVSKYRIIVQKTSESRSKRSFSLESETCDQQRLFNYSTSVQRGFTCYIAAEISGADVSEGGYSLNLGDGETYGGYENAVLSPVVDYSVQVAVVVIITEDGNSLELLEYLPISTFKTPAVYQCEAPPAIENALLNDGQSERSIDSFVTYSCKVGFTRTRGDVLRCELRDGEAVWAGETPKCEKPAASKDTSGQTIGLSIPLALLAITVIILVSVICTIKRRQSQANSAPSETDINMTTRPASNTVYEDPDDMGGNGNQSDEYMKLGGDRSSHTYDSVSAAREPGLRPAMTGKSDVYVNVNQQRNQGPQNMEYEVVSVCK